jgi:hypothetical protein
LTDAMVLNTHAAMAQLLILCAGAA